MISTPSHDEESHPINVRARADGARSGRAPETPIAAQSAVLRAVALSLKKFKLMADVGQPPGQGKRTPWETYMHFADIDDNEMLEDWKEDMDNLLIFVRATCDAGF